jgi:hypothetical protein
VGNLPAVEILVPGLGVKKMSGTRTQDGGWELVGVKLPALETLRRGKGCRPALLSTGSGCPTHSAFGKACGRKITGTRDLTPGI